MSFLKMAKSYIFRKLAIPEYQKLRLPVEKNRNDYYTYEIGKNFCQRRNGLIFVTCREKGMS